MGCFAVVTGGEGHETFFEKEFAGEDTGDSLGEPENHHFGECFFEAVLVVIEIAHCSVEVAEVA